MAAAGAAAGEAKTKLEDAVAAAGAPDATAAGGARVTGAAAAAGVALPLL